MPTNKETLDLILKNTQDLAKSQLDFDAKVSIEFNKQDKLNKKLLGYLENNEHTNQKGAINRLYDTIKRVDVLEEDKKISLGKKATAGFIFASIGGFAAWLLNIFITK